MADMLTAGWRGAILQLSQDTATTQSFTVDVLRAASTQSESDLPVTMGKNDIDDDGKRSCRQMERISHVSNISAQSMQLDSTPDLLISVTGHTKQLANSGVTETLTKGLVAAAKNTKALVVTG
eukprot:jgi/Mesvir1/18643/Mv17147-RA.1